jgi:hypothetical protein
MTLGGRVFTSKGHERDDVVANRTQFCKTYLTELEPYCRRWIQLSLNEATIMKALDIGLGHSYFDIIQNHQMIKFHIDYWNRHKQQLQEQHPASPAAIEVQPTTSVRVSSMQGPL